MPTPPSGSRPDDVSKASREADTVVVAKVTDDSTMPPGEADTAVVPRVTDDAQSPTVPAPAAGGDDTAIVARVSDQDTPFTAPGRTVSGFGSTASAAGRAAGAGRAGPDSGTGDGETAVIAAVIAAPRPVVAPIPIRRGAHRKPRLRRAAGPPARSTTRRPYLVGAAAVALVVMLVVLASLARGSHGDRSTAIDPPGLAGSLTAGDNADGAPIAGDPFTSVSPDAAPSLTASPVPSAPTSSGARTARTSATPTAPVIPYPRTTAPRPPATTTGWTSLTVSATKVLSRGNEVHTNRIRLTMRSDGNLAIVDEHGATRWTSGTDGVGRWAVFQADGNFVVYDGRAHSLWTSRTAGHDGAVLVLQADGNVCITSHGSSLWCAGTAH